MHEFGHNIGLHHSGYGTASYADHSCIMGNPSYGDDGPQICWNAAKVSYLDTYYYSMLYDTFHILIIINTDLSGVELGIWMVSV